MNRKHLVAIGVVIAVLLLLYWLFVAEDMNEMCIRDRVEGAESIEILGIDFGGTVAPHQLVLEEDYIFCGLPNRIPVGRYHSWVVDTKDFPEALAIKMCIRDSPYDCRSCNGCHHQYVFTNIVFIDFFCFIGGKGGGGFTRCLPRAVQCKLQSIYDRIWMKIPAHPIG